ncbi:MAG: deoxynucleoside kinase [bacterium]
MYILEGNIGVGKSTFLNLVARGCSQISIIQEQLGSWDNRERGKSLLEQFYNNPKRWAYTMETLSMVTRVKDHVEQQKHPNPNRIMERSVYSGHYCFAVNGNHYGFFNEIEWAIYVQWVRFLLYQRCQPPRGFIYLKADPEVCMQRVYKRGRLSEKSLSLDYIRQIHDRHEAFLVQKADVFDNLKEVPVLVLDCNREFESCKEVMAEHLDRVKAFLQENSQQIDLKTL